MRKILVLRGGALGDFLVTLPALALLRRRWPEARIELAGNATAAQLALDARLIDAVHSQHEARWSGLFTRASLPVEFAAWLGEFDLVVNYWPDPDGELRAHFPARAGQTFLHGEAQPGIAPAAAHYCEALRTLGIEAGESFYVLSVGCVAPNAPSGSEVSATRRVEGNAPYRIALHPGSGSSRKNWPLDRWATLAEWLARDCHAELLIVTGEAESAAAQALARFGTPAHDLRLRDLAAQLARCRLFVGHDSGVSHLAAACRVPCVLLFGPTDPATWAPPAPHVSVIRRGAEMSAISAEDVRAAITAVL